MLPIRGAFHSQLASIAQITISFTHVSRKIYRDSKTLTHRFEHEPNNFGYQRESIRVKYGWTESTRLEEHSRTVSNSIKGAQSQIKPFERNSRLGIYSSPCAHYTRPTNRTGQFSSTRNTYTMFACLKDA